MSESSLAEQSEGDFFCRSLAAEDEVLLRLKRFGICENRPVTVLQSGDPMILLAAGAQLAISRQLAESVSVSPASEAVEADS